MPSRKAKQKSIEFWVEPYKCKVFAGTCEKALSARIRRDIKKELGKKAFSVTLPPAEEGGAYTTQIGDGVFVALFDDARPGHMVHEAIHIANLVLSRVGQDPTYVCGEDEYYAYLVEDIFNKLHDGLS